MDNVEDIVVEQTEVVEKPKKSAPKKPKFEWVEPEAYVSERIAKLLGRRGFGSDSFVKSLQLFFANFDYAGECNGVPSEDLSIAIQSYSSRDATGVIADLDWAAFLEILEKR